MRCRVLEFEASQGSQEALTELSGELNELRQRNEMLDAEAQQKDKELEVLRSSGAGQSDRVKVSSALQYRSSMPP